MKGVGWQGKGKVLIPARAPLWVPRSKEVYLWGPPTLELGQDTRAGALGVKRQLSLRPRRPVQWVCSGYSDPPPPFRSPDPWQHWICFLLSHGSSEKVSWIAAGWTAEWRLKEGSQRCLSWSRTYVQRRQEGEQLYFWWTAWRQMTWSWGSAFFS